MNRIDKLEPGQAVQLRFENDDEPSPALFLGVIGEGDDRRARFVQAYPVTAGSEPKSYEWDAYRYQGRWVYGTSAQRLQVAS